MIARMTRKRVSGARGAAGAAAPPVAAAPPPPPAAAPAGDDLVSKIKELSSLKDAGVLTDDEFNAAKQKLLAS